ncbi:MAG: TonB-dependent receptor [Gemmatimonadales bacterium]
MSFVALFRVRRLALLLGLLSVAGELSAQQNDSTHQHGDTLTRPVKLGEITVTATRARRDAPASSVTVPAAELRQIVALNAYDLIRQAAGIEVHEQGQGPGFASDASVRGFSSDHSTDLALWVDGVPINEPINGHGEGYNDWELLFPQAISTVDVIKGPTSALYGNFALSGVVNVRTLERFPASQVWGKGGSYGRLEGAALTGFDHGRTGGVIGIRGERDGGWRPNSDWKLGQLHGRIVHDLSNRISLDAGVELYAAGWNSPGFITDSQFAVRDFNVVANSTDHGFKRRGQERISLRVLASPDLLWRSTVYATQGRWQLFLTTPPEGGGGEGSGSQTEEEDRRYGFGVTSALTYSRERTTATLGVEGRYDHSKYENFFTTNTTRDSVQSAVTAHQATGALFLETSTNVGHHFRLDLGTRLEVQQTGVQPQGGTSMSAGKSIVAPKAGLLYHLPRLASLYANVSRGFRQTDGIIEDPTLPFISAWAYETGLKLDAAKISASVAVFRMDVTNEQTFNPITLASSSGGRSRRQGVELELHLRPTDAITLTSDWTFNDARYRQLIVEGPDTLDGARVYNTARFVGSAALAVAPPASIWRLRLSTNAVGPYSPFDMPGVVLKPYALAHASGSLRFGTATLGVGMRNLLGHRYREVEAGGFNVPGQPRTVYGSLDWIF